MNIVRNVNSDKLDKTAGFTQDQVNAYNGLIEFINSEFDPKDYKRALVGFAGSGKTFLLKRIINDCNLSFSVIGLAAPTHKAKRILKENISGLNITVNSLASDLGLKPNYNAEKFDIDNPPFDPYGRIKIEDYKLYIVDEASMIPDKDNYGRPNRGLRTFLEKYCLNNQCKIIYVGDDAQLNPVGENYISAFKGIKSYHLNEIVRQEKDNPVAYLLELLRYDVFNKTATFINYISRNKIKFDVNNVKGYQVCNGSEFSNEIYKYFSDEQITKNIDFSRVICYTNASVSYWNKFIRNNIIKDSEKSIISKHDLLLSYITIVNEFNEAIIENGEEYIIDDIVNYVHPKYQLKGYMVKFISIHGGKVTKPLFVIDYTNPFTIQMYLKISNSLINDAKKAGSATRAQRWRDYFKFKESCLLLADIYKSDRSTILFGRNIDYGFAITSHKSQGSTYDTAFVDVYDIVFDKNGRPYTNIEEVNRRLYVACSRCRNKLYLRLYV